METRPGRRELIRVVEHPATTDLPQVLERWFDVEICGSIREARDRCLGITPAAHVLDLTLPNGRGVEVVREFQCFAPHVPMVVVTVLPEGEISSVDCLEAGAQEFLRRPIQDPINLLKRVTYAIARHRVRIHWAPLEYVLDRVRDGIEERLAEIATRLKESKR